MRSCFGQLTKIGRGVAHQKSGEGHKMPAASAGTMRYPHTAPLICLPALGSKRMFANREHKEMAVTVPNATEKSGKLGAPRPPRAMERCSMVAPRQMPSEIVSCWKVE